MTESRKQKNKQQRALNRDRRHRLVEVCCSVMRNAKSPFNAEGPMRCGLRAGLCLDGMSWHTADDEAAHIVAVALRYMGSGERPTWNEGQPDWTHPDFDPVAHTRCIYCGRKIPDDRTRAGRGVKYCSAECISYAYGKRSRIHMEVVSRREDRKSVV